MQWSSSGTASGLMQGFDAYADIKLWQTEWSYNWDGAIPSAWLDRFASDEVLQGKCIEFLERDDFEQFAEEREESWSELKETVVQPNLESNKKLNVMDESDDLFPGATLTASEFRVEYDNELTLPLVGDKKSRDATLDKIRSVFRGNSCLVPRDIYHERKEWLVPFLLDNEDEDDSDRHENEDVTSMEGMARLHLLQQIQDHVLFLVSTMGSMLEEKMAKQSPPEKKKRKKDDADTSGSDEEWSAIRMASWEGAWEGEEADSITHKEEFYLIPYAEDVGESSSRCYYILHFDYRRYCG